MGQKDPSPPLFYGQDVQRILDRSLALSLPDDVLEHAAKVAFARGLETREAAILICHEHGQRLCRQLVEQSERASDLVELVIASRIDECANLASELQQDLLDLLPDLPEFVQQPCFSDEFRDIVAQIAIQHRIPEHHWSALKAPSDILEGVKA